MNKAIVTAKPGESTIRIERVFDAPREKFFAVVTNKELIPKWWIGPGYDVRAEEMDVREGGRWKFVQSMQDGSAEYTFFGTYHEVTAPERIIQTFEFSGLPERGHVILEKMELQEVEGGKTKLVVTQSFFSAEERDGMLQSGMEEGMQNTYDTLDKILAEEA
jgi:uncharacterized protein YndB with AHSA1/START domain